MYKLNNSVVSRSIYALFGVALTFEAVARIITGDMISNFHGHESDPITSSFISLFGVVGSYISYVVPVLYVVVVIFIFKFLDIYSHSQKDETQLHKFLLFFASVFVISCFLDMYWDFLQFSLHGL